MPDPFECEPRHEDKYYDVDLLRGLRDASRGKVRKFFEAVADEHGISFQQSIARLTSEILIPEDILRYCAGLVQGLHLRSHNRDTAAWEMATEEVDYCIGYFALLSDGGVMPMPVQYFDSSIGTSDIFWDVLAVDHLQDDAAYYLPFLETMKQYCTDETALDGLDNTQWAVFLHDKHASV